MLHILRSQKVQKRIYIGLAIAVISSFVVSGLMIGHDDRRHGSEIGRIRGHKVMVQDYLSSYKAVDHQARIMYGQSFDQVRPYINFKGEAWDRLLLLNYAKEHHIKVGDDEVINWIGRQTFLQNRGQFDEKLYQMFVTQYLKEDARRFEEEIRQMLTIVKIQDKVESSLHVDDNELRQLYNEQHGKKEIEYAVYQAAAVETAVNDEDLKKIYPLYQNTLIEPSKAKIRYILITKDDEARLKDALADTKSSLPDLASKYGLTVKDTPFFSKNEAVPGLGLVSGITDKSFTLRPHEVSAWITAPAGHFKIELMDKTPAKALTFDEGKEQLKKIYLHQKSVEESLRALNSLSKDLKPGDFEKFAADQKLKLETAKDLNEDSYLPEIGPAQIVLKAVAQVKEGAISRPVPVPGGAALIKVLKNTGADDKKFAEDKEAFRQQVIRDRSRDAMDTLLTGLRKDLVPNSEILKEILPEDEQPKA